MSKSKDDILKDYEKEMVADYEDKHFEIVITAVHWGITTKINILKEGIPFSYQHVIGAIEAAKMSFIEQRMKENKKVKKKLKAKSKKPTNE